jgi:hypothetical protein
MFNFLTKIINLCLIQYSHRDVLQAIQSICVRVVSDIQPLATRPLMLCILHFLYFCLTSILCTGDMIMIIIGVIKKKRGNSDKICVFAWLVQTKIIN